MKSKLILLLAAAAWLTPLAYAQASTETPQTQPGTAAGSGSAAPACPPVADKEWPVNLTIEARLPELLDSSRLKPGKKIFATVLYEINYAECSLADGAILYGHVTAADSSTNPDASELGLTFDHADCRGHDKQEVHLRLIGVVAPPSHRERLHDALPSEVAGGVQQLPETSNDGIDGALNPAYYPRTVRPGLVVRLPKVKLEPEGGPGCSARISIPGRNVQLAPATDLILTLERVAIPKK